jgi:hypothetical protein
VTISRFNYLKGRKIKLFGEVLIDERLDFGLIFPERFQNGAVYSLFGVIYHVVINFTHTYSFQKGPTADEGHYFSKGRSMLSSK